VGVRDAIIDYVHPLGLRVTALTLLPKVLGGYSGTLVEAIGYPAFFVFTTLIGVPVLLLVWLAGRHLRAESAPGISPGADSTSSG
jgi:hypothetical protein